MTLDNQLVCSDFSLLHRNILQWLPTEVLYPLKLLVPGHFFFSPAHIIHA